MDKLLWTAAALVLCYLTDDMGLFWKVLGVCVVISAIVIAGKFGLFALNRLFTRAG